MLKKHDFFCADYKWTRAWSNPHGKGITHSYIEQTLHGDKVVLDKATGLMWQKSGSSNYMTYAEAKKYIRDLNNDNKPFAGLIGWRLPTLEEAMSLMEPRKQDDMYINPMFGQKQGWIWTADKYSASSAWLVTFDDGYCGLYDVHYYGYYVRAVR